MTADDRNILRDVAAALEAGNASPLERASLANALRLIVALDEARQTTEMLAGKEHKCGDCGATLEFRFNGGDARWFVTESGPDGREDD